MTCYTATFVLHDAIRERNRLAKRMGSVDKQREGHREAEQELRGRFHNSLMVFFVTRIVALRNNRATLRRISEICVTAVSQTAYRGTLGFHRTRFRVLREIVE